MYGQVVQPLQESDMFVTYLREDDTFETLLARLGRITGDPERIVEKYRLAVIRNFIPCFLHREADDAAATRKRSRDSSNQESADQQWKKTKMVEVEAEGEGEGEGETVAVVEEEDDDGTVGGDQQAMQIGQGVNGAGSEISDTESDQRTSVWSTFERFYPLHMGPGNRSAVLNTNDYPVLGVQRPSGAEGGLRR